MKKAKTIINAVAAILAGGISGAVISGVPETMVQGRELVDGNVFEEELTSKICWNCAKGAVIGASTTGLLILARGLDKAHIPSVTIGISAITGAIGAAALIYKIRELEDNDLYSYQELHEDGLHGLRVEDAFREFQKRIHVVQN